jgi:hypothetical protein
LAGIAHSVYRQRCGNGRLERNSSLQRGELALCGWLGAVGRAAALALAIVLSRVLAAALSLAIILALAGVLG